MSVVVIWWFDLKGKKNIPEQPVLDRYLLPEYIFCFPLSSQELKAKDDQYVKELKKRTDNFDLLIERMESQMKSMQRAYTFELQETEVRTVFLVVPPFHYSSELF